jgi:UTP:GlnB (protein PII) uridylyltransferase
MHITAAGYEEPVLFLKARRESGKQQPDVQPPAAGLLRDLEMVTAIARRAGRRRRQTAAVMDGVDLDRARHCLEHALDELGLPYHYFLIFTLE